MMGPMEACPISALPAPAPVHLTTLEEHACPYLPGRTARTRAFLTQHIPPEIYHDFMNAGFRRSGRMIYQPVCHGCRACIPLRIPVQQFKPSKSQRRCWRKNQDLRVEVGPPQISDEKYALYCRYLAQWHGRRPVESLSEFASFLYESPVYTIVFCYRDAEGCLLGVGLCDLCARSLSSVYFYHDPAQARRGLGTFSAMYEIHTAKQKGIPYYYMGYWILGCSSMQYKTDFRPYELLHADGQWR